MENRLIPSVVLDTDSYKLGMFAQYPPNTTQMFSYFESRGGRWKSVMFFGLQYYIKKYFTKPITIEEVNEANEFAINHGCPFNYEGWKKIVTVYGGKLPIKIRAVPEGSIIPVSNILFSVESSFDDADVFWVVSWLETMLVRLWYPCTIATYSYNLKQVIKSYLDKSSDDTNAEINFKLHDFGSRGVTCQEQAMIGGASHLINFMGSDTIAGVWMANKYYSIPMAAFSIAASEHSTITMWGKDREFEAYKNMIKQYGNAPMFACVSDSYNIYNACENGWGGELKQDVLNMNATLIQRPDCYDDETQILTNNGWKYFKELNMDDLVAEVNDDETYSFVKPLKYIDEEYDGDMYTFKDHYGKVNLMVTPNHRIVIKNNNKFKTEYAEDIKIGTYNKKFLRGAKISNGGRDITPLEKLKIAFQADGSFCTKTKSSIRFSFSKQRKIDRLENILNMCDIEYKIYKLKDGRVQFNIKTNANDFKKHFSWVNINELGYTGSQQFIEELSYWDATRRSNNKIKFDTTNETVIHVVELIAMNAGYGVLITRSEDNRKQIFNDIYTAHIMFNNYISGQSTIKEKIKYCGRIYCVQVPSGRIIIKRGRSILVCGNSGDPDEVVNKMLKIAENKFGYTINSKGYKVLNKVRIIQGDGINGKDVDTILKHTTDDGYSATNIAFGMGGGLLQKDFDRDTQKFAFKCCWAKVDGKEIEVYKDPITDQGKQSKKGILDLELFGDRQVRTINGRSNNSLMKVVYENGELLVDDSFETIRARANDGEYNS